MLSKLYKKLEFDLVLENVASFAFLNYSKDLIKATKHQSCYEKVVNQLESTDEFMKMFSSYNVFSLGGLYDINNSLSIANSLQVLDGIQLKEIASIHEVYLNLIEYKKKFNELDYPIFSNIFNQLYNLEKIASEINFKINFDGLIYEDATELLKNINFEIESYQKKINSYLKRFINDNSDHLMDNIITYRNNRAVILVKLSSKNIIKGIIHDESISRQTVFIEPSQVVEYNNNIQSLEYEKNEEVKRILLELTNLVRQQSKELLENFNNLVLLDTLKAKAQYSLSIDGIIPTVNKDSAKLEIYEGRHPLINKDDVVANDFFICNDDTKYRIVLISGSNTGGKTVALKMVGLFSLMMQSGIAILANERSNLPIYKKIFVDVGDEQSIVESLSTFSSHLSNVVNIVNNVCKYSLVLLDELGSGTDPREGENLALSIIEYLYNKDASVIVTTHYSKLKNYAISNDYVRSASVMFDNDFSRPSYKIAFDTYASSNAFEIAKFLGLNSSIVEKAKEYYQSDLSTSDELMLKLADRQMEITKLKESLKQKQIILDDKYNEILNQEKELITKKQIVLEKAQSEANDIVLKTKQETKSIIKDLKDKNNFINHEVNVLTKKLDNLYIEKDVNNEIKHDFKLNDLVEIIKLNRQGIITKVLNKNSYEISVGNIKTKVKSNEIKFISKNVKQNKVAKVKYSSNIKKNVPLELNLIGQRVEDALLELQKYLDSALIANYSKVRIVHGFGTGALRKAVHNYLSSSKNVKSYKFAEYNEGGQGATIVELK